MRYSSLVLLLWSLFPSAAGADQLFATRPVDAIAAETLSRALASSPIVRALVARLESSNVIVHVQTARIMPAGLGGFTQFVTSRGGHRYLRITLSAELRGDVRTGILAHELQHACEVADSGADDAAGLRRLFNTAGRRDGEYFETRAAILVERMVRDELQAEPVVKFDH